jgi:DNA-binding transcriptional LysR family regulator
MDALAGMQAFNAVVESGGFAAAATRLGLSRALISKRVAALERALGARLLARTTRRVAITEAGAAFHRRSAGILANFEEARAELGELQAEPRGTLKVSAPMSFGTLYLGPLIGPFLAQCPGLSIELTLNDRFVDLLEDGVDVAIRIGTLRDSTLVARRLAGTRHVLCAAPAYLKRHAAPHQPADLADHRCLHYGYLSGGPRWRFAGPERSASVAIRPVLTANNGDVLRAAALDGQGIVLLPDFIIARDLKAGRLVGLLPGWRPPESAVHAIRPAGALLTAKVRRFIDFLAGRFARPPWQAPPG